MNSFIKEEIICLSTSLFQRTQIIVIIFKRLRSSLEFRLYLEVQLSSSEIIRNGILVVLYVSNPIV